MAEGSNRTFSLAKLGEPGRRAVMDGLKTIGESLRTATLDADGVELIIEATDPAAADQIAAFVQGMTRTHRLVARKVLRQTRPEAPAPCGCTDAQLAASPDIHLLGEGLTGLGGPVLGLFRYFEGVFRSLARDFGAQDRHYPVMLPARTLLELGYVGNFPQHVTFCCPFRDSLPVLEEAAAKARDKGAEAQGSDFLPALAPPETVLTPAVCLPCYSELRGITLDPGEVRTLTMQNHVFRYEANAFRPLARGWDFSVRDIVFFGSNADLVERRAQVMEHVFALAERLELDVSLELANDPFFLDSGREKVVYQRMGEVKYELLFRIPGHDTPLAASSFNLHRYFYTATYGTHRAEGELAESACMGFGLDRWLYGFLMQKGLDRQHWPAEVRAALE